MKARPKKVTVDFGSDADCLKNNVLLWLVKSKLHSANAKLNWTPKNKFKLKHFY